MQTQKQTQTQKAEVITLALVPETETRQLQSQAAAILAKVAAMPVTTPDEFKEAGAVTVVIAKQREANKKRLKTDVADVIHQGWKRALEVWQQVDAPYERAEKILSGKLSDYHVAEARKRQAIEAEARHKAEEEARQKQAAMMKAMEESRQAQITKAKAEQEARALAEAARLEAQGKQKEADALVNIAFNAPAPEVAPIVIPEVAVQYVAPVLPQVAKVEGLGFRTEWKWALVDINLVPREHLMLNESSIGGVVRSMKDKTNIPGIRVFSEQVATKARR